MVDGVDAKDTKRSSDIMMPATTLCVVGGGWSERALERNDDDTDNH
jgi:hypothetical protein